MNVILSPAQRAAQTRAARKAGLASPAADANATATRDEDVSLDVVISEGRNDLVVTFRFVRDGIALSRDDTPEAERALLDLCIRTTLNGDNELSGHHQVLFCGPTANAASLRAALSFMLRIDRFLALALDESEDPSFAQSVNCIAAHLRATRIVHVQDDGSEVTFKRGAAYISAHRIAEAFVAAHA